MSSLARSSGKYASDERRIQEELEKLEVAIERLLLQDPEHVHTSRHGTLQAEYDEEIDNGGGSFSSAATKHDIFFTTTKKLRAKDEEKILERIKRLQAVCIERSVGEKMKCQVIDDNSYEIRDSVGMSTSMTKQVKETSLDPEPIDIEALRASDISQDFVQNRLSSGPATTLKMVVACQEIISVMTFSPEVQIEVAIEPKKQESQLVRYRRTIPMVLTLPDDESSNLSFKEQVKVIYNAFRMHNEKRTKFKYSVFSWLLKNGTSFYASTAEQRFARRKRGSKWMKKMKKLGSLSEQEILEAGLRVLRKRIRASLKPTKTQRQTTHVRNVILSWLHKLEIVHDEEVTATSVPVQALSESIEPSKSHRPESVIRPFSNKDIEGSLLLSGLEIRAVDSTLRGIGLEGDTHQTDRPEEANIHRIDQGRMNSASSTAEFSRDSIQQELTINEPEGCNLLHGTYDLFVQLFEQYRDVEKTSVENTPTNRLDTQVTTECYPSLPSDVGVNKCETNLERNVEYVASGVLSLNQTPSTLRQFTSKDDEGDRALINALVELLSQDEEPTELLNWRKKNSSRTPQPIESTNNASGHCPLIDAAPLTPSVFEENLAITQSKENQDEVSQETDAKVSYVESSTSAISNENQSRTIGDPSVFDNSNQKPIAMMKPVIYKPSFEAADKKPSGMLISAKPEKAISRRNLPSTNNEAMGLKKDLAGDKVRKGTTTATKHGKWYSPKDFSVDKHTNVVVSNGEVSGDLSAKVKSPKAVAVERDNDSKSKASTVDDAQIHQEECAATELVVEKTKLLTVMTKSTRIERLRKMKKSSDRSLNETKLNDGIAAIPATKQTQAGMLPVGEREPAKMKGEINVAKDHTPIGMGGRTSKKALTSLGNSSAEHTLSDEKKISQVRVDPPKKYGRSSIRRQSKSKTRGRRPPFYFQPQLATHYEASTSDDDVTDPGQEGVTSGSHEDRDLRDNDDDENASTALEEEGTGFLRARSERCDSFEMMGAPDSDSSSEPGNQSEEKFLSEDNSVLSSLASMLNHFHGMTDSIDCNEYEHEYRDDDNEEEGDGEDESVCSGEEDSSEDSGAASREDVQEEKDEDNDEDGENVDREAELDSAEQEIPLNQRFKYQYNNVCENQCKASGKKDKENNTKSVKTRIKRESTEVASIANGKSQGQSGFFLSNRIYGSNYRRSLHQNDDSQHNQPNQQQPEKEKSSNGKLEERKSHHFRHEHRRKSSSPVTMNKDADDDAEIEVREVLPLNSIPSEKQIVAASATKSPLPLPTQTTAHHTASATNITKKAWTFLSRRKSERQGYGDNENHRQGHEIHVLSDEDHSGEHGETKPCTDCRDDAESNSNRSQHNRGGSFRLRRSKIFSDYKRTTLASVLPSPTRE